MPEVLHFVRASGSAWLLTSALPGRSAYDCLVADPARRLEIAAAVGAFLRTLHALPLGACPFHAGHELRLAEARRRLEAGEVDASDFDAARAGWSAERVWKEMTGLLPLPFARVVTHGDFSLGNVLLDADGRVTGCLDVGRAGAADPHQDVAILWRDLEEFGPDTQQAFLRAYGLPTPDERMLAFHLCLDEFF